MSDESVERNRLRLLPPIRRSRLWRLYAEDGRRFLDFWMDGGRSLLGAKGSVIGTVAKACLDTGLTRPFPSVREARLRGDIRKRYPEFAGLRLYRNEDRAIAAASAFLAPGESLGSMAPFAACARSGPAPSVAAQRVLGLRLPCPAVLAPGVLLFKDAADALSAEEDLVPPLLLACAHRALCELDRFAESYAESLWKRVDRRLAPYFERSGPYLYPLVGEAAYGPFFEAALGAGVLLSPCYERPSTIPGDFDDGELAALAAALA